MTFRDQPESSSVRIRIQTSVFLLCLLVGGLGASSSLPYEKPARGKFLIAGPEMRDPNFSETVILLLEYDETGALGLIINWPTEMPASDVLPDVKGLATGARRVFIGGPVRRQKITLLVQTDEAPEDARHIFENIYFSGSGDLLARLASEKDSDQRFRLYLGCAGWGAGQLDSELARGGWRVLPGEASIVFDPSPEGVWPELVDRSAAHWTDLLVPDLDSADIVARLGIPSP